MAKRRSNQDVGAKQDALTDQNPTLEQQLRQELAAQQQSRRFNFSQEEWSEIEANVAFFKRKEQASQRAIQLVLDAFSKAEITFDPRNETDAKWLEILKMRYGLGADGFISPNGGLLTTYSAPRLRIQDKKSRLATERLLSKLAEVRSAILLCEKEAERGDLPDRKQNVALRVREELYRLQTIWKRQRVRVEDHEHSQWIEGFIDKIDDLGWSAAQALEVGVHAPHGKSNTMFPYTIFVRVLYEVWTAKKSTIGVYKSGGRWTGPFVEVVERCEELVPIDLRPPSANARGKRVARAIGAHKQENPP
jgi:hypothetical protein